MSLRVNRSRCALVVSGMLLAACGGGGGGGTVDPPATQPEALALEPIVTSLVFPTSLCAPPGDSARLFVTQKDGVVRVIRDRVLLPVPFLDLFGQVSTGGEQGLFALAFDPAYATNRRFYVSYTDVAGDSRIVRYTRSPNDPDVADPASAEVILEVAQPANFHNGGPIAFGPDGYLYVALGDGGADPGGTAQDAGDLLGSMMRIDVRASSGYAVPSDNPFVGVAGARPEVWNVGLRNPWRFSFDRANGDLYIGDVGHHHWEEIDVAKAASGGGENYGWSDVEGASCFPPGAACDRNGTTLPAHVYAHSPTECAVVGGYVYRGAAIPGLQGAYFFADFCAGWVRSFREQGGAAGAITDWPGLGAVGEITSFGEDAAGELYVLSGAGGVYRIVAD